MTKIQSRNSAWLQHQILPGTFQVEKARKQSQMPRADKGTELAGKNGKLPKQADVTSAFHQLKRRREKRRRKRDTNPDLEESWC